MRYGYAKEKLGTTFYELAVGEGDVRERLRQTFLIFHTLQDKDFPTELQKEWTWIHANLTKHGPIINEKGDVIVGSVQNTMRHIRKTTGARIAKRLINLYFKLREIE